MDPVGNRQQDSLHRGQPDREGSGEVLDQDAHEALQRAQDHPVQHHRAMAFAIVAHVSEIKALRQGKIALNGSALPTALQGVFELDVDFGPVEGALALADAVGYAPGLEGPDQGVGGQIPLGVGADGFLRAGGQFHFILEPEDRHDLGHEIKDPQDFAFHLLGHAQDMGIILGKLAHPGKAVQDPGALVAQDGAQLEIAQGQLPVAPHLGLVDEHVGQAVHGLDAISLAFHFGEIHVFPVIVPVAGALPQIGLFSIWGPMTIW